MHRGGWGFQLKALVSRPNHLLLEGDHSRRTTNILRGRTDRSLGRAPPHQAKCRSRSLRRAGGAWMPILRIFHEALWILFVLQTPSGYRLRQSPTPAPAVGPWPPLSGVLSLSLSRGVSSPRPCKHSSIKSSRHSVITNHILPLALPTPVACPS